MDRQRDNWYADWNDQRIEGRGIDKVVSIYWENTRETNILIELGRMGRKVTPHLRFCIGMIGEYIHE
jgi:hypothetical protein